MTDLGSSVGLDDGTGINDLGQVIGYETSGQGFIYSNGHLTNLGRIPGFTK